MGFVGLFLSGAVLFLNSLLLLDKAEAKSVGVFNLFVGALQIIFPFYMMITSSQSNWDMYNNAAVFLFGLTYLYVGVTFIKGLDGRGLGWFCLWVVIIALIYTVTSIVYFHDIVNALTWGMWAYLWFLFFLLNSLQMKIEVYVGIVAFIQSWVTLTIPAILFFLGVWNTQVVIQIMIYVLALSILSFVFCAFKFKLPIKKEKNIEEIQAV